MVFSFINLIYLLTVGTIISIIFGEFGKYPFGAAFSAGIQDILVAMTVLAFIFWKFIIEKKIIIPKAFKLIILFWAAALVSLFFSNNLKGILYLLRYIFYSSLFLVGFELVRGKIITSQKVHQYLFFTAILLAIIGFFQFIFFPDLKPLEPLGFDPHKYRLFSTFLDPNFLGTFLNICLVSGILYYLQTKSKKILVVVIILLCAIFLTFSRSAYLMMLLIIFFWSIKNYKKILLFFCFSIFIAYLLVPKFNERISGAFNLDKSSSERLGSWKNGVVVFLENPSMGVGFNNLSEYIRKNNLAKSFQTENTHSLSGVDSSLLFILATTGITGFIIYLSFWSFLIYFFSQNKSNNTSYFSLILILALFINSQFINSLFYPEIMIGYFLYFGVSMADISDG